MTLQTLHRGSDALTPRSDAFALVCFGLLVANIAYLVVSWDSWILDSSGKPAPTDFLHVYTTGRLVIDGQPAAAYDWDLLHQAETAVLGRAPNFYLGWHYPPPFLGVAALLATLPYAAAFGLWLAVTLPLYLATIRAIVGDRIGWLIAGAFPCLMPNVIPGQNGFLTASLIGGTLVLLERQPLLAGLCLGLLTYKPQFGILFPLVLVVGGHWKAIGAAAVTAVALVLASLVLFGVTPWSEFFRWLPLTSQALFSENAHTEWHKFQSLLALVRMLGGSATLAWALQLALAAATAIALCVMWYRKRIAFELKAAATATGVLLATPYVYLYDLTVLAVPVAFLVRCALVTGFARGEAFGLALVSGLFLIVPFLGVPVGLFAAAIVVLLIARRVLHEEATAIAAPQ
jgi:arabinofuranan 3-O-arabinosyltransferase